MSALHAILVHLDGTARAETRLRLAHRLAGAHQAVLTALFAVAPRYLPLLPLAGGVPSIPMPPNIDPGHRAHALALFERTRDAGAPESEWRELSGEPVIETFARRALASDLMVLGQRDPADKAGFDVPGDFVESAIIESGKPALVIPHVGEATATPRSVLVAWKPTRESARALAAALPFLRSVRRSTWSAPTRTATTRSRCPCRSRNTFACTASSTCTSTGGSATAMPAANC